MSQIAFTFPGQGSQAVGMGVTLADQFEEVRRLFTEAGGILGWDLLEACKNGPEERLRKTDVAQPALYVTGVAAALALQSLGLQPNAVAGHSIGEYAALTSAGVFSFADGLKLVRERGRLMQEAAQKNPGGMVAVLGLSREQLEPLCADVQARAGVCVPVNFNSPEQTVIAGEKEAIAEISKLASEKGAKRVIPLNVAGAFHSPLMKEAADGMTRALAGVAFQKARIPAAMNVDGRLHTEGEDIRKTLERQLTSCVEWVRSVEALKAAGCSIFVECGSGRVLSGLLRRIDKGLQAYATDTADAVRETAGAVVGAGHRPVN